MRDYDQSTGKAWRQDHERRGGDPLLRRLSKNEILP